jgi:hypothetical protein
MNSGTGAIAYFETDFDAKQAGFDVELSEQDVHRLKPMNRKQRRAEAAKMRKSPVKGNQRKSRK